MEHLFFFLWFSNYEHWTSYCAHVHVTYLSSGPVLPHRKHVDFKILSKTGTIAEYYVCLVFTFLFVAEY